MAELRGILKMFGFSAAPVDDFAVFGVMFFGVLISKGDSAGASLISKRCAIAPFLEAML
jgi:hypothetical protein